LGGDGVVRSFGCLAIKPITLYTYYVKIIAYTVLTVFLIPTALFAQEDTTSFPAKISPGYTITDARTLNYMDFFLPVYCHKDGVFFLNPKVVIEGSNDVNEQNIGGGYRHLLFNDNLLVGTNLFYDRRKSKNDRQHHQLGFGFEAFLWEWIDLRSNFYYPISGYKTLGTQVNHTFGTRSLIAHSQTFFEEPLRGMDYEAGLLVPLVSNIIETRLYMGGYYYHSKLGPSINGLQARVEARPIENFVIDAQINHDDTTNTNAYFGMYVSVPFDIYGMIAHKKNPLPKLKDALAIAKGPRKPRKRITDMVVRDIDIVSASGSKTTTTTAVSGLTFVDNSNAGAEDGSFENPYDTIQEGVNNAQGDMWVYVREGSGNYNENVVLADNVTLWGSGYDSGYAGILPTGYPIVDGAAANVITLADNNVVMGLDLRNGTGINAFNTGTEANISHNILTTDVATGFSFIVNNGGTYSNIVISNNTFSGTTATTISGLDISNNTISNPSDNLRCIWFRIGSATTPGSVTSAVISDNAISDASGANGRGIEFNLGAAVSTISVRIERNTIINNGGQGIRLGVVGANTLIADLGGGSLGSAGNNSIYGNAGFDIDNLNAGLTIMAENNWWGTATPLAGQFNGNVDYTPWLASDPN
jgi:hypothetical protein